MRAATKNGVPTPEARELENCFLLSGFARTPEHKDDVSCLIALTYNEKATDTKTSEIADVTTVLPEYWGGKFIPHYSKAEEEFEEAYGWTHMALLEGDPELGVAFKANVCFADDLIRGPFIMCAFNSKTQKYHHFHCVECCHGMADFFLNNQPVWKVRNAKGKGRVWPSGSATRH